jgi:hypothetical protein
MRVGAFRGFSEIGNFKQANGVFPPEDSSPTGVGIASMMEMGSLLGSNDLSENATA